MLGEKFFFFLLMNRESHREEHYLSLSLLSENMTPGAAAAIGILRPQADKQAQNLQNLLLVNVLFIEVFISLAFSLELKVVQTYQWLFYPRQGNSLAIII